MRLKYGIAGLLAAAMVAACGGGDDGGGEFDDALAELRAADLAPLVLPLDELGAVGDGLALEADGGEEDNARAAEQSADPDDTADDLAEAGRISGYAVNYVDPDAGDDGAIFIITSNVTLFDDADNASAAMSKAIEDFEAAEGEDRDGQTIDEVEAFEVEAGDESRGVILALETPDLGAVRGTAAYGRIGRLGFTIGILSIGEEPREEEARALAETHAQWIRDVLSGEVEAEAPDFPTAEPSPSAVSSPVPDPVEAPPLDQLALQLADLPEGFAEAGAGFETANPAGEFDYTRSFDATGDYVELGAGESRVISIENNIIVFETAAEAQAFIGAVSALLEGEEGAGFLRTLIEQEGITVLDLTTEQRDIDLGDQTVVVEARATTMVGDISLVFIMSRQGRSVSAFIFTGDATSFEVEDISPLAETVFGRLNDAGIE